MTLPYTTPKPPLYAQYSETHHAASTIMRALQQHYRAVLLSGQLIDTQHNELTPRYIVVKRWTVVVRKISP